MQNESVAWSRFRAQSVGAVKASPTIALTQKAKELRAAGRDVIALTVGEPDFPTSAVVCQAAKDAIDAGHTKYTGVGGIRGLRAAICRKLKAQNDLSYEPENIALGCGGKEVIYNALSVTLNTGDEVIMSAPYWVSYPEMVGLLGGVAVPVRAVETATGLKMTPESLRAALTEKTKWVILNSPSNPTGAIYSRDELAALAEVLVPHEHVLVMSDEIYEHLRFDGLEYASILNLEPELAPRTLVVNGFSKSYAMTGWRVGYGAGPRPLIEDMARLQSHTTYHTASVSQYAALAALDTPAAEIAEMCRAFESRRDRVVELLSSVRGLKINRPQGAFYLYVGCADCIGQVGPGGIIDSDEAFARQLLEHANVAVTPGAAFGYSPFFRIAYAVDDKTLTRACKRLADFCYGLRPR